jgi:AcrR family transcriptional regulator
MTSSDVAEGRRPGLRERKKAKTRAAIQQQAMRLFRERGYAGTTVEDIAEAAEISPTTFFRYFPTKEDVVLSDDYDEVLLEAFLAQPLHLTPLQATRAAIRSMTELASRLSPEEEELEQMRISLAYSVPEVRARWTNELARVSGHLAEGLATRAGRPSDDVRVRTFVGAVMGVITAVVGPLLEDPSRELTGLLPTLLPAIDEALGYLEQGLPL